MIAIEYVIVGICALVALNALLNIIRDEMMYRDRRKSLIKNEIKAGRLPEGYT